MGDRMTGGKRRSFYGWGFEEDAVSAEELGWFEKTWSDLFKVDRFDPARKFSSWLFKIAHNTALDALRRRGEEPLSLDAPVEPGGAGARPSISACG